MARPIPLTALGRGLALLTVAGGSVAAAWLAGIDPSQLRPVLESGEVRSEAGARRLIVYRLDRQRPTVFRFTQPVLQARVIVHPVLGPGPARPGEGWTYGFKAELLGIDGEVMATREIYSRAILLAADGAPLGPRRYFRDSEAQVAMGDEVRIAGNEPFASLRLTTLTADPAVRLLDVRVSERRPLITSAAETAFYRYSPDDQARLAAANAFPPVMLTQGERTSIAVNQWRPVGPLGIDGRDHEMGVLYEEMEPATAGDEPATQEDEVG